MSRIGFWVPWVVIAIGFFIGVIVVVSLLSQPDLFLVAFPMKCIQLGALYTSFVFSRVLSRAELEFERLFFGMTRYITAPLGLPALQAPGDTRDTTGPLVQPAPQPLASYGMLGWSLALYTYMRQV